MKLSLQETESITIKKTINIIHFYGHLLKKLTMPKLFPQKQAYNGSLDSFSVYLMVSEVPIQKVVLDDI